MPRRRSRSVHSMPIRPRGPSRRKPSPSMPRRRSSQASCSPRTRRRSTISPPTFPGPSPRPRAMPTRRSESTTSHPRHMPTSAASSPAARCCRRGIRAPTSSPSPRTPGRNSSWTSPSSRWPSATTPRPRASSGPMATERHPRSPCRSSWRYIRVPTAPRSP